MKYLWTYIRLSFLLLCVVSFFHGAAQGVSFETNPNWDSLLKKSSATGKLIFVDLYTDWCVPCKIMDQQVFSDPDFARYMEKNFINCKLNAERKLGYKLNRLYKVDGYPTFLFIDGNGTLIYRSEGARPLSAFIRETENALSEQRDSITLETMEAMYPSHKADTNFMYTYLRKRTKLWKNNMDLLDEYCQMLEPSAQNSLKTLSLIIDNGARGLGSLQAGPAINILIRNYDSIKHLDQVRPLDEYIRQAQNNSIQHKVRPWNEWLLQDVLALNKYRTYPPFDDNSDEMLRLQYYYRINDNKRYIEAAIQFMNTGLMVISDQELEKMDNEAYERKTHDLRSEFSGKPGEEIQQALANYRHTQTIQLIRAVNQIAARFIVMATKKQDIQKGVKWMERSVQLAEKDTFYFRYVRPHSISLYAAYLYETGRKAEAIVHQEKALQLFLDPSLQTPATQIKNCRTLLEAMKQGKKHVVAKH